jgi:hypothetical protein
VAAPDRGVARGHRDRKDGGFAVVPVAVGLCIAMIMLTLAIGLAVISTIA